MPQPKRAAQSPEASNRTALPPLSRTVGDRIEVRGLDLAHDLVGQITFTEMLLLELDGVRPTPNRVRAVDAVLVTLMEHGITPSTLGARLVLDGAPESLQGAIAAGLLAVGARFLGVVEEAGALLAAIATDAGTVEEGAGRQLERLVGGGARVPGFGHNLHDATDPRVAVLAALQQREGLDGEHLRAFNALQSAVRERLGPQLIPNAAGAVAALLGDLGYEPEAFRGFALVARCGGLFAHILDERANPVARQAWQSLHDHGDPK